MNRLISGIWRRLFPGALLATLAGLSAAQTQQPNLQGIYSCTDAKGRRLSSDRPIPECSDREQTLRNPSGSLKATIRPALSARERTELEAKEKAAQQEQARVAEEKRRDQALLRRYPKPAVHEQERAAALAQTELARQGAANRTTALLAERAALLLEMEFYKKDPSKAPAPLRRQLEAVAQGLAGQERLMAEQDAERQRINARFDELLLRLKPLWALQPPAAPASSAR